jgi:hypothetical protein
MEEIVQILMSAPYLLVAFMPLATIHLVPTSVIAFLDIFFMA